MKNKLLILSSMFVAAITNEIYPTDEDIIADWENAPSKIIKSLSSFDGLIDGEIKKGIWLLAESLGGGAIVRQSLLDTIQEETGIKPLKGKGTLDAINANVGDTPLTKANNLKGGAGSPTLGEALAGNISTVGATFVALRLWAR